ncbi:MAG TPA: hypothetical protein VJ306_12410 [Pyrinomonadaceae bacterium]|jgi:hypothetical protein|nr:hypothetical protein [Pyrinomonadaceae bacterium]
MIRTVEKIKISETTTSYRVAIDDVNSRETLDERYQRHREAVEDKEKQNPQPIQPPTPK